ncbi:MAG: DUF697 domain-containing protein [Candidatus Sericytochromatia bacterium]|nr:DUF697 domain-containing protein [Candidatus Sericytochromatia bacterium]
MALPPQIHDLWSIWREMSGMAERQVPVNLYATLGPDREALKTLFQEGRASARALRVLELSDTAPPEADVHLVLAPATHGPDGADLAAIRRLPPEALLVLLPEVPAESLPTRRREVAANIGIRAERVVASTTMVALRKDLAKRILQSFPDQALSLARQFPFLREEATQLEIVSTSQQNAMVGLIPVPGADMPVMTINQVKMVLRLAAIHDQPMTPERLKEVLAVVGGGLALRTVARQAAKLIPGPGWLVAGGLGYAGTLAMGKAAVTYFKRTSPSEAPVATLGADGRPVIEAQATVVAPAERGG